MSSEERVVDNRTFLLGLDSLYREAMKRHERGELLQCACRVAAVLNAPAACVPVEGYYAEDSALTEYFCLMRTLQEVNQERTSVVDAMPEFKRLLDVTSAPLFGKPIQGHNLLPTGRDALSQALNDTKPEWSLQRLTETAYTVALKTGVDDHALSLSASLGKCPDLGQ
jgi:hypothetical protein